MHKWKSVRVRITMMATSIVAFGLVFASFALVVSTQNSLSGQARSDSQELVGMVADALRSGVDIPQSVTERAIEYGIAIQIRDENKQILQTIPGPDSNIVFRSRIGISSEGGAVPALPEEVIAGTAGGDNVVTYESNGGGIQVRRIEEADNIIVSEVLQTANGRREITAITPLAQVAKSVDPVIMALRIGTPILILLVGFVTWFITGRALQPIEDLRRQAASISETHPDAKLPVPDTADEVERLARTLNAMLARIDTSATRQREFVSDASHELRSPIAAMHTTLEVAQLHPHTTTVPQLSADLLRETNRMQNMVTALLDLARVENTNRIPLDQVDISAAIEAATGEQTTELIVEADADQIEGALRNLVDNAKRHATSKVDVSIVRSDHNVTIIVEDDGPGIPTEQRERIFERFARLDEGRARAAGGVGIGLALVQRIAERHHGAITVDDSPLGGARFSFQLPLRQPS